MSLDLSWLDHMDADTRVTAGLVAFALLIAALALLARAERQIRGGLRYIGKWTVLGGRWVAARWDARWQGCPRCDHCLGKRRAKTRARWARLPRPHLTFTPAWAAQPGPGRCPVCGGTFESCTCTGNTPHGGTA